jgi:sulfoxide reductase heme-binding subunit YedZ
MKIQKNKLNIIKGIFFVLLLIPLIRLIILGINDALGANPIETIERSTGYWALFCLLVSLSITPLRLSLNIIWPIHIRRMIGLYSFFYACLHAVTYFWLDHWFDWQEIFNDIFKHPYVLVGFLSLLLLIPLAITSTNKMMKAMGRWWKRLHYLVYLIAVLSILHFLWLVKKDITEPALFAIIFALFISIRIFHKRIRLNVPNDSPR